MDLSVSFSTSSVPFLVLLFSILWLWIRRRNSNKKKLPPQVRGAWPILGHLRLLGGPEPPHLVLSRLADKYGPLFTIKLGVRRAVVINSHELARECFTTNDKVFANRPKTLATEILGYNHAMFGFSPYGAYWRHARKIATLELLSNYRLDKLSHVREAQITESIKELYQHCFTTKNGSGWSLVDMRQWFADVTLNMALKIIVGKRLTASHQESKQWKKALKDFFELSGRFLLADGLPFIKWFGVTRDERRMRRTARELDVVAESWLRDHKEKKLSGVAKEHEDFMDVMLSIVDQPSYDLSNYDNDTIVKAMCLVFILGASDTTMVTLTWALSLLVNNPDVLKKAQKELDEKIGRDEQVKETDTMNLPYIQAIIKETMRLYPAAPLSLMHESLEDCMINGYHIPAGTTLITNIPKIQRDPRVWTEPSKFQPERFMTTHKDIDVKGQNFELIPFSSGRRMCPGVSLGLRVFGLVLAKFLHGFNITMPMDGQVDMEESIGLTNMKANPLNVLIAPRLPTHLY